jgi:hypothetical protein
MELAIFSDRQLSIQEWQAAIDAEGYPPSPIARHGF